MSEESSSYTWDLDRPDPTDSSETEPHDPPKRKIVGWALLGICEFLLASFAIAYVSFVGNDPDTWLDLWLQIYGVADAVIVLVEAWLMIQVTLTCNVKVILVEMAITVAAILFFVAWSIVGIVLLLETSTDSKVWIFSLIVILYQILRFVVICALKRL